MNEQQETKTENQPTAEAQIADLPLNGEQADQVKGGPTSQSKRTVVLQSSFGADSADE